MGEELEASGRVNSVVGQKDVPERERRGSARHLSVLQIAKLSTDQSEELCVLRDVSATGLKAEIYRPLPIGSSATIELKTGNIVTGKIVWAQDRFVGMQFDRKVPILTLLAHRTLDRFGRRIRRPRLNVDLKAILRIDDRDIEGDVRNVSQAGMKLRVGLRLGEGKPCQITVEGLDRRAARVQWSRNGEAGIMLVQPMSYPEFADWRQALAGFSDQRFQQDAGVAPQAVPHPLRVAP